MEQDKTDTQVEVAEVILSSKEDVEQQQAVPEEHAVVNTSKNQSVDVHKTKAPTSLERGVISLQEVDSLIDMVIDNPVIQANFSVNKTAEDGTITTEVSKSKLATCIMLGHELGFSPMKSITLGTMLDRNAVIKVEQGRLLGLDPMSALRLIYVFPSGGRDTIAMSYHLINGILTSNNIKIEILENPTRFANFDFKTRAIIPDDVIKNNPNGYFNVKGAKADHLKAAIESKKVLYEKSIKHPIDIIAKVRLTRDIQVIETEYCLQDAIDAHLASGINSDGESVKGKDNWDKYPIPHVIKMATMTAARIIASDKIAGIYATEELPYTSYEECD